MIIGIFMFRVRVIRMVRGSRKVLGVLKWWYLVFIGLKRWSLLLVL